MLRGIAECSRVRRQRSSSARHSNPSSNRPVCCSRMQRIVDLQSGASDRACPCAHSFCEDPKPLAPGVPCKPSPVRLPIPICRGVDVVLDRVNFCTVCVQGPCQCLHDYIESLLFKAHKRLGCDNCYRLGCNNCYRLQLASQLAA
jgi:hypothetical protein